MAEPLLYPPNWTTIAFNIKEARNWQCEDCGITQGENLHNNITVHHHDHNTFNNDPSNLIVCCQICHLARERKHRSILKQERFLNALQASGQLIFPGLDPYPLIKEKLNIAEGYRPEKKGT